MNISTGSSVGLISRMHFSTARIELYDERKPEDTRFYFMFTEFYLYFYSRKYNKEKQWKKKTHKKHV